MSDLFSCHLVESPTQHDAPCRVHGDGRGRLGVLLCYICTCGSIWIQWFCIKTYVFVDPILLHSLLLLLLLLLILYIDFLQLHSRHRQTYIFCHCFKQSEYSTTDECIKCHPTYMAGRLQERVTDWVSRKSTSGLCRRYLLYIRDTCNILWTGI